jgi:hypothetical protein
MPGHHFELQIDLSNSVTADTASHSRGATGARAIEVNRPRNRKRAQGMPDARCTRGRLCSKKAQASATKGTPQQPAFPAQWFYGLYVISPVTGLSCHRRLADRSARLSASVGAPGPYDFAVRCNINRPLMLSVHRIPLPTFVTIAKRPSYRERDLHVLNLIWGQREAESFCARGWTGFRARRFFCPTGKSLCRFDASRRAQRRHFAVSLPSCGLPDQSSPAG